MLDRLDPAAFYFICVLVEMCCVALGFVASALLKDGGFTPLGNTVILNVGAFGALYGLDALYRHAMLPLRFQTLETWIIAPPVGACGLLVFVFFLKVVYQVGRSRYRARRPHRGL